LDEEKIFCLSCGQAIQKEARFCPFCGASVRSRETSAPAGQSPTRLCLACGRSYPNEFSFCPHCGSYPTTSPPPTGEPYRPYPTYQKEPLGGIKYVAFLLAFLIPIIGIIWGIIWLLDKDQEKKDAGKITIVIALASWFLAFVCLLWSGYY
jgi:RNA polymerase subunit RPABC4/transcription elongation factor Spt4